MFISLVILQVFILSFCETRRIAYTRSKYVYTTRRSFSQRNKDCIAGCTCVPTYGNNRNIDCSYQNLSTIPDLGDSELGRKDFLNLRGNNIQKLKHSDFEKYGNLYGLDLRDNSIGDVPVGVFFNLQKLNVLLLTARKLHYFSFHGLDELTKLHIDGEGSLTELHITLLKPLRRKLRNISITNTLINTIDSHALSGMTSLQYVHLQNNQIEYIKDKAFEGSVYITVIVLSNNNLTAIPKFGGQNSLQVLRLGHNSISTIEKDTFQSMVRLRTLDLSHNKFEKFSKNEFRGASSLDTIFLQGNLLKTIPSALLPDKCSTLRTIDLSENQFSKFVYNYDKRYCMLSTLKLRGNPLTFINTSALRGLSNLDISKNCKLNYTKSYFGSRLYELDLSENCLRKLPKLKISPYLSKLNLYGNEFRNIQIDGKVASLNISSNNLENLTLNFRSAYGYGVYDLSNNKLKTINKTSNMSSMRLNTLILKNNSFAEFNISWITSIRMLDLSNNKIKGIENIYSQLRPSHYRRGTVSTLILRGNQITKINKKISEKFPYLNSLDLSENQINKIDPDTFLTQRYLYKLDLSSNNLTSLSQELYNIGVLQKLNLSNNALTTIDKDAFKNMLKLKSIDISHNRLKTLPQRLSSFTESLRNPIKLNLAHNELECSCNITVMLSYYKIFQPSGQCEDKRTGQTKSLKSLILTFKELVEKKCDICDMRPCKYHGQCTFDKKEGFKCTCYKGFTGNLCETTTIDCPKNSNCSACVFKNCKNGGTCIGNERNLAKCLCAPGYIGKSCEKPICHPSPCRNNGHCMTNGGKVVCRCPNDYLGKLCESYQGNCNSSFCGNRGVCIIKDGENTCFCQPGFSGTKCEVGISNLKTEGSNGSSTPTSAKIAIAVLVILLAFVIVILVALIRKRGMCKKNMSNDRVELVDDYE